MNEIPLLLVLLALSAFFSASEIAIFSLSPEKIQALKNKSRGVKLAQITQLELLKSNTNKLLVTILIGNNVVNIAASSIATLLALKIGKNLGVAENTNIILATVTGAMTFLVLVFGEITPKIFGHKYALQFSLISTPVLRFLQTILYPIIVPLAYFMNKFSGEKTHRHGLSEDELKAAIELSEKDGQIDTDEKELFERVLEFDEHTVETIMTPRSRIFAIADNVPSTEALKQIAEEKHSRVPVFHEDLDEIIGILSVQTLLEESIQKGFKTKNLANLSLLSPMKIPRTMKIDTLLKEFQKQKNHMALVYDEYGGMIGLITLEDVLEEIFGEFEDEHDEEKSSIRRAGKKSFICNSETELEQIETFIKKCLPDLSVRDWPWPHEEENKTIAYFLLEKLERFPRVGEKIEMKAEGAKFNFVIKKMEEEQIQEVEIILT